MSGLFSTTSVSSITADAVIPEQLVHYVTAVSGLNASLCGSHVLYTLDDTAVLVIFDASWCHGETMFTYENTANTPSEMLWQVDDRVRKQLAEALTSFSSRSWKALTVLAPAQAELDQAVCTNVHTDCHWALPLPLSLETLPAKVRNMIRHGERYCRITQEPWTAEHTRLVSQIIASRNLPTGTQHIYKQLGKYAKTGEQGARLALISARTPEDNQLQGFVIGDLSSLTSAFYMFAFRAPTAPAGTADALLFALAKEAMAAGHIRLSLGLGIHDGVAFFKKKWNAIPFMPHVETQLTYRTSQTASLWSRLFAKGK